MSDDQDVQPHTAKPTGLALMRAEFAPNQMSKLPKGTKAQNECPPDKKQNCNICGGWHHPQIKHLDYVGHAAVTDRLLDCDPEWTWEPVAFGPDGLPALDASGGLWIRLTVCGVSRLGYGNAQDKGAYSPGDRLKEVIGDAIRNAAMRFGAALELWHKGDLHLPDPNDPDSGAPPQARPAPAGPPPALPAYPAKTFEDNMPAWTDAVKTGKRTTAQLLAMIGTKGTLSEAQRKRITNLETEA